jgi:hypothetical protein
MSDGPACLLIDAATSALETAASVAAAFAGKTVRVLQPVPEYGSRNPVKYPYVTFGGFEKQREEARCDDRFVIEIEIHVWDDDRTVVGASRIAEACEGPLLKLVLSPASGFKIVARKHVYSRAQFDQESGLIFAAVRVSYTLEAIAQ